MSEGTVVSIFSRKRKDDKAENTTTTPKSFEDIARENKEREEKLKRERAEANKGVLKSYRIK